MLPFQIFKNRITKKGKIHMLDTLHKLVFKKNMLLLVKNKRLFVENKTNIFYPASNRL